VIVVQRSKVSSDAVEVAGGPTLAVRTSAPISTTIPAFAPSMAPTGAPTFVPSNAPSSTPDLFAILQEEDDLSIFVDLAKMVSTYTEFDVVKLLTNTSAPAITVLAPTNGAFAIFDQDLLTKYMTPPCLSSFGSGSASS